MGTAIFIFFVSIGCFVLGMIICSYYSQDDRKELQRYRETYLFKSGCFEGYEPYSLISLDGGECWYAYDRLHAHVVILGTAEEKFPGLLGKLKGLEDLAAYTRKNGPLTLDNIRAPKEIELLRAAGFEVVRDAKEDK